ncbi:hypothetical protein H6F76_21250 [Leptolyngbya sp. FACHB-321]|uniref:hypothetical protein n=1 Tax=Leptolyngbya sp. FACHB-321 TaxID=2692807 RepID=UPI001682498B|nr:hypothetical protein [Leptolyngbya sp. FACHB-321]MBD2037493.1 hypothetical protein [Leptolyngbya sp. FACHB-321]
MPKLSQPSVILSDSTATQHSETSFTLETVRQTVLKLVNPLCQLPSVPNLSDSALLAMQRLMEIITTLRSSQPFFLEGVPSPLPGAIEALLPYVSEEAYDVLEALQREEVPISPNSFCAATPPATQNATPQTSDPLTPLASTLLSSSLSESKLYSFIAIETLIPSLLWRIARSDYSVMHLIEGVRGRCWQSETGWATGMLRLVVMLEVEAPTVRWCFDLATGEPAEGLLESSSIIQSEEQALPLQQSVYTGAANDGSDTFCQVEYQLQAILQLLQSETGLGGFLQGVAVELLQPGAGWQAGKLQLRFGFEFTAQVLDLDNSKAIQSHAEPIEAELMEDETQINGTIAMAQVAIVKALGQSLSPAALVRASDATLLAPYIQQITRQQLAQSLCLLQRQFSHTNESEQLTTIVQAALLALAHQTRLIGIGLQQPTLLLDELAPKLLWSLTRHTYEMTQLLGGVPAQVLQPGEKWQQGTLRLLAVLQITAPELSYTLDLSTGRAVPVAVAPLPRDAIVQSCIAAFCQQPTAIATLADHLEQLCDNSPEQQLLVNGFAVDWLKDVEQDWQSGTMTLSLSLVFFADTP